MKYGRVYNSDAIDVFVVVKNGAIGLKSGIMKLKQRGNKQNKILDVFVVVKNGAIGLKSGIMKLKQRGNKQNKNIC